MSKRILDYIRMPIQPKRRRVKLVCGVLLSYLVVFVLVVRIPIVEEGTGKNFPIPFYFYKSSSLDGAARVCFWPLTWPFELSGVLKYRKDLRVIDADVLLLRILPL